MGRWGRRRSREGGTKPRATVIGFLTPVCEGYANEKADWLISGKRGRRGRERAGERAGWGDGK